jgi:hypothetical protein
MRAFTNNFLAQASNHSALPYLVLEIDWGGPTGVQYYLDRSPTSFVNNDGHRFPAGGVSSVLVLDWGHIGVSLKEGQIGVTDQTTVTLDDTAGAITDVLNSVDQQRRQFTIWRMFDDPSVAWNTDKGRVFTGILRPFSWTASDNRIILNLGDVGPLLAKDVSLVATDAVFDKLPPSSKQMSIPLVWGQSQRVEALPISVPWEARLAQGTTGLNPETVAIVDDLSDLPGVVPETDYEAILGTDHVTVRFHQSPDPTNLPNTVTISAPGPRLVVTLWGIMWSLQTTNHFHVWTTPSGVSPWQSTWNLHELLTIGMEVHVAAHLGLRSDIKGFTLESLELARPDANAGIPGSDSIWGEPVWRFTLTDNGGEYLERTFYSNYGLYAANSGGDAVFTFYSPATIINPWPAGTLLRDADQTTVYAVNALPSLAVRLIEGFGTISDSAGASRRAFAVLGQQASSYFTGSSTATVYSDVFTVNPNDSTWSDSAKLGRNITTITFPKAPRELYANLDDDRIWCTVQGVDDAGDGTGELIDNPATVILNYLENPYLMGVAPSSIDADSFAAAAVALSGRSVGFAQMKTRRGLDLLQEIAMQCNSVLLFDQGVARMVVLSDTAATPVLAFDTSLQNYLPDSLVIDETAVEEGTNELVVPWRASWDDISGNRLREVRASKADSIAAFGPISRELPFRLYWRRDDVEAVAGWWLDHWSTVWRTVKFTAYLDALVLQPGDWISVRWVNGSGRDLFGGAQSMMVVKVTDRAADHLVDIEARYPKFTYAA